MNLPNLKIPWKYIGLDYSKWIRYISFPESANWIGIYKFDQTPYWKPYATFWIAEQVKLPSMIDLELLLKEVKDVDMAKIIFDQYFKLSLFI